MRWRTGMVLGGALIGGYGAALLIWPQILLWTVAGIFLAVGALFVLSAVLARGPST